MRYRTRGKLIASELAAKPPSQASAHLVGFLKSYDRVAYAVDYGCGKLRYASALTAIAESVTLVDSSAQLDRKQVIEGRETIVRRLVKEKYPTARIETITEFEHNTRPKFDFALCANVLSAIPTKAARSRALAAIKRRLKASGTLLVVNQHTNSSFTKFAYRDGVIKHLDGWLIPRNDSAFYYGILDKEKTCDILETAGYRIVEHWIDGQSNYALARIR
jgi:SAM-dependent methyltransferase